MKWPEPWFVTWPRWKLPGRLGAGMFALPFLAAGVFVLVWLSLGPVINWARARSWEECPATILASNLDAVEDSDGDTYQVKVRYRYRFAGRSYESTRFDFSVGSTNVGVAAMREAVARLRVGTETSCWVDPRHPAESVLDRSWPPLAIMTFLFSIPFLLVGIVGTGGAIFGPWLGRRAQARYHALLEGLILRGELTWPRGVPPDLWDRGDIAFLSIRDRRLANAATFSFVCVFWNGIVAVFVFWVIVEWYARGHPPLLLSLFLIPFISVGLLIGWGCVRAWRLLRRPSWVAVVSPLPAKEGGQVEVALGAPGATLHAHPPRLVQLVATENEIDSESGTPQTGARRMAFRRKPGKRLQWERELARVDVPFEAARGLATIRLPPVEVRSEPHRKRALVWSLEVEHPDGLVESHVVAQE